MTATQPDEKEKDTTKAKRKFDDYVTGEDGTVYAGEIHESLREAVADAEGTVIYARSETYYDPESRAVKGNRWVPVAEEDMPVGGAIPGEWKRVTISQVENRLGGN